MSQIQNFKKEDGEELTLNVFNIDKRTWGKMTGQKNLIKQISMLKK
jgi:cellobiose-specific phosphotransferase system component IIB